MLLMDLRGRLIPLVLFVALSILRAYEGTYVFVGAGIMIGILCVSLYTIGYIYSMPKYWKGDAPEWMLLMAGDPPYKPKFTWLYRPIIFFISAIVLFFFFIGIHIFTGVHFSYIASALSTTIVGFVIVTLIFRYYKIKASVESDS